MIGCGYAATVHVPALVSLPGVRLVAVADVNESARQRLASGTSARTFADYRDLLAMPEVDAVAVLTPPHLHLEMALATLEAGKHLLLEKPITRDLEEADVLLARAGSSTVTATVGYTLRFHAQVLEARRLIREGALGRIQHLRGVASSHLGPRLWEYRKVRDLGGDVLVELGVHHYDLWRFLLGEEVEEVTALERTGEAGISATVAGRMTSGVLVSTLLSHSATEQQELEILGDAGRVRLSLFRFDGLERAGRGAFDGDARVRLDGLARAVTQVPRALRDRRHGGTFLSAFRAQWSRFVEAIRAGEPVEPDLGDGRRSLQVALAAIRSADTGQRIRVAEAPRRLC